MPQKDIPLVTAGPDPVIKNGMESSGSFLQPRDHRAIETKDPHRLNRLADLTKGRLLGVAGDSLTSPLSFVLML